MWTFYTAFILYELENFIVRIELEGSIDSYDTYYPKFEVYDEVGEVVYTLCGDEIGAGNEDSSFFLEIPTSIFPTIRDREFEFAYFLSESDDEPYAIVTGEFGFIPQPFEIEEPLCL